MFERYALARRSSMMVFNSRIASSTSVFVRRILPGREGAVLARLRDGEGRRDITRAGDSVPEVSERWMEGFSSIWSSEMCEFSGKKAKVGVAMVPIVVPDNLLSCEAVLF